MLKISKVKKPNHQFKEPTVAPGDNRPSVYNRRISSEQIELPDGRICTRVPARKWSKVKIFIFVPGIRVLVLFELKLTGQRMHLEDSVRPVDPLSVSYNHLFAHFRYYLANNLLEGQCFPLRIVLKNRQYLLSQAKIFGK